MDEISKKDLLAKTGISYGQLYRWKREGLIPEEWFIKRPSFTGQETWFPRERILDRVAMILGRKDDQSLGEIRRNIEGEDCGELDGLLRETLIEAEKIDVPASAVLFETNDGKHFVVLAKDGRVVADPGVKVFMALSDRELKRKIIAGAVINAGATGNAGAVINAGATGNAGAVVNADATDSVSAASAACAASAAGVARGGGKIQGGRK